MTSRKVAREKGSVTPARTSSFEKGKGSCSFAGRLNNGTARIPSAYSLLGAYERVLATAHSWWILVILSSHVTMLLITAGDAIRLSPAAVVTRLTVFLLATPEGTWYGKPFVSKGLDGRADRNQTRRKGMGNGTRKATDPK